MEQIIEYDYQGQKVKLSISTVKKYLTSGEGTPTDQEAFMFMCLCRYQGLNPYVRDAYLIKMGNEPASTVISKDAFTRRAQNNKFYAGQQSGVCVLDTNGSVVNRVGALVAPKETLIGGWAKVFINGYEVPIETSVSLGEYIGVKKDGTPNRNWSKRPATMIRKVALVQALREAFPDSLAGLYTSDEMGVDDTNLSTAPIEQPKEQPTEQPTEAEHTDESIKNVLFG